jgi:hypothetical protein
MYNSANKELDLEGEPQQLVRDPACALYMFFYFA